MRVLFRTRPGWGEMGDLVVGDEDLGWSSLGEAQAVAAELGTELVTEVEADYVVKNPRRE